MNKEKMFALNTPEFEIQVELMLISQGKPADIIKLVSQGWGVYPQILNALVVCDYTLYLYDILTAASVYEKYPVKEMKTWLEAYFEQEWKLQTAQFGLHKIAEEFFSAQELEDFGFKAPCCSKKHDWDKIAKSDGMDLVKSIYVQKANCLNQGSSAEDKNEVKELEYYLAEKGEYEFLYNRGCWRGLSHTLGGVQYIAETRHYMNGLASCLLGYYLDMDQETLDYCIATLDKAQLDDNYRPLYAEWKERRS